MNTTSYDIEDHHLELLIPIVGSGCTVLTLFLKGIISKLFPKVNVNDGGGDGGEVELVLERVILLLIINRKTQM